MLNIDCGYYAYLASSIFHPFLNFGLYTVFRMSWNLYIMQKLFYLERLTTSFFNITNSKSIDGKYVVRFLQLKMHSKIIYIYSLLICDLYFNILQCVPVLFEKLYYSLLSEYDVVECGGLVWPYSYIKNIGALVELKVIEALNLGTMHTIIFSCNKNMTASLRFFRKDGMEVVYDCSYLAGNFCQDKFYMATA